MRKNSNIKKYIVLILVFSFLNFSITPAFAADHGHTKRDDLGENLKATLVIGGIVLVGLLLILAVSKSHSAGNPQTINQALNNISSDSDKMLTPSGELVVFKW